MDAKIIEEVLRVLVAPNATSKGALNNAFQGNIKNMTELLNSSEKYKFILHHLSNFDFNSVSDIRWNFTQLNITLIQLLHSSLKESAKDEIEQVANKMPKWTLAPPLPSDVLSVSQEKTVTASLQFIVLLGISPYLLPGVGVPLNRRSEFATWLEIVDAPCELNRDEMDRRLLKCTLMLLEFTSSSVLNRLITSRHLVDLLSALFQIRYSLRKCLAERDGCCSQVSVEDYDVCTKKLDDLLEKTYQPIVIQQLLLLQNGVPPPSRLKLPNAVAELFPSPIWLKKLTRKYLIQAFIRPQGIQSLFAVLLQGENEKSLSTSDWKKYQNIARIIVECPLGNNITVEDYYEKISNQIIPILRANNDQAAGHTNSKPSTHLLMCRQAAVQMVCLMSQQQPLLTQKFIMNELFKPLLLCLENTGDFNPSTCEGFTIVVEENVLSKCIADVHMLLIGSGNPGDELVNGMLPVLGVLFPLYCHIRRCVTCVDLRKQVEEILQWIFQHMDLTVALDFLSQFCLQSSTSSVTMMDESLGFCGGESGGVSITICNKKKAELDPEALESLADNIIGLITSAKRESDLGAELFLLCLKQLTDLLTETVESTSSGSLVISGNAVFGSTGLNSDVDAVRKLKMNLVIISLISVMCEKFGPSCFTKTSHIVEFVEATLKRQVKVLENTNDVVTGAFGKETLTMALDLLTSLLASKERISSLDWTQMEGLLPLFQKLSDSELDAELKEVALNLQVALATHGLVQSSTTKKSGTGGSTKREETEEAKTYSGTKSCGEVHTPSTSSGMEGIKLRPLIEVLENKDTEICKHSTLSEQNCAEQAQSQTSEQCVDKDTTNYQQAMEELCDSSVPIRGHGLIALRRLIDHGDAETLTHHEDILKVCQLNLSHSDSYIYLSAIQVMTSLADKYPKTVLTLLTVEYSRSSKDVKRSPELQMKIGEVLVKVSSHLGEMMPYYRDLLLGSVLSAVRDPESLVRASAVSNLGEICRLLRFSLDSVMHEIFSCIQNLLKYNSSAEVRRSAAMFCTLLFRGLSKDAFKVLGSLLTEFYRLLKHARAVDTDDIVRHHVQLAIEELDIIVRDYTSPPKTLTKRIYILDPPCD